METWLHPKKQNEWLKRDNFNILSGIVHLLNNSANHWHFLILVHLLFANFFSKSRNVFFLLNWGKGFSQQYSKVNGFIFLIWNVHLIKLLVINLIIDQWIATCQNQQQSFRNMTVVQNFCSYWSEVTLCSLPSGLVVCNLHKHCLDPWFRTSQMWPIREWIFTWCVSPCGSACLPVSVKAASVCALLLKSRTDWCRALGGVDECDRLSAIAATGPCVCGAWGRASGGLSLIAWLTAAAFYAHGDTHSSASSKSLFKALSSLRQTEWYLCHLSLPMSEAQPGSGVIWCRHAPRASLPHRVTPHWAWLWPGSRSGLGGCSSSQVL